MYIVLILVAGILVGWPVAAVLAFLGLAGVGDMVLWPAVIVLGVLWYRNRRPSGMRQQRDDPGQWELSETAEGEIRQGLFAGGRSLSFSDLLDLAILRLDLDRRHASGGLSSERHAALCVAIDRVWLEKLHAVDATPGNEAWCARRARGFGLLTDRGMIAGGPPWAETKPCGAAPAGVPRPVAGEPAERAIEYRVERSGPSQPAAALDGQGSASGDSGAPVEARGAPGTAPLVENWDRIGRRAASWNLEPVVEARATAVAPPETPAHEAPRAGLPAVDREAGRAHALRPDAPNVLERALQAITGWHTLIAPFLAQNIGWFIGGFCFVAGSGFLVSQTSGFGKALAIWGCLLVYTLMLIGGGYTLRRRRPELRQSSEVLSALGVLLVPLTLAAATRLLSLSPSLGLVLAGAAAAVVSLGLLYPATLLASGITDRRLAAHPRLFLALSATQLAVPILELWPSWAGIALIHVLVAGLLGHAILRFTDEWLQAIRVARRASAIYAAGTLFYAAAVAFVHGAWGSPEAVRLPPGYYGPFLMAACGLMLFVDARLKHWSVGQAFLSRFSLAIYALSVLALGLAAGAPICSGMTLVLAIGLYGFVAWHYLTLAPLYLMLGSAAWLYGLLVLRWFDPALHLLFALPGLAGLYALNCSTLARRSARLGEIAARTLGYSSFSLTAWSLWNGTPGWAGFATGAGAAGLCYALFALRAGARGASQDGAAGKLWRYGVLLLCAITLAYAPRWPIVGWATQFSLGLMVLAALWTGSGLARLRAQSVARAEVLLDGALLAMALAVPVALFAGLRLGEEAVVPVIVLAAAGWLLFRMAAALSLRPFVYAGLGCVAMAGVLTKLAYFPEPSAGAAPMALSILSWLVLFALEIPVPRRCDRPEWDAVDPPVTLLGSFRVSRRRRGLGELLCAPLAQAMVVMWLSGIAHLWVRLAEGRIGWAWALTAATGAVAGALSAARFRRSWLVAVALVLGLGASLAVLRVSGYATPEAMLMATIAYALAAWIVCVSFLRGAMAPRCARMLRLSGGYGPGGGRAAIERTVHTTATGLCLLGMALTLGALIEGRVALDPPVPLLFGLATAFWGASAWRYRHRIYAYATLAVATVWVLVLYGTACDSGGLAQLTADRGTGLVLVLLALGMLGTARIGGTASLLRTLYAEPLRHMAVALGLIAVGLEAVPFHRMQRIDGLGTSLVLALGGVIVLCARVPRFVLEVTGVMLLVLALACAELVVFHEGLGGMSIADPGLADLWILIASVSALLALLADAARVRPLARPVSVAAGLCYGAALLAAVAALGAGQPSAGLMLTLALALPPLRWPIPVGLIAPLRGAGVALLASAALAIALPTQGAGAWIAYAGLCWAYVLYALSCFAVPRFNARWPRSALDANAWPWIGLGCLPVGLAHGHPGPAALAFWLCGASAYLFLLLRRATWPGWAWVAVFGLATAGAVSLAVLIDALLPATSILEFLEWLLLALLAWANVLLYAGHWWRHHGSRISRGRHDLAKPFTAAAALGIGIGFMALILCVWDALLLAYPAVRTGQAVFVVLLSLALCLSMVHAYTPSRARNAMHGFVAGLGGLWLGAYLMLAASIVHPPLVFAGFASALLLWPRSDALAHAVLRHWCGLATLVAMGALVLYGNVPIPERLATLAVVIGSSAALGSSTGQRAWCMTALGSLLVFLHAWPLAFVPVHATALLLPWYAAELAALAIGFERLAAPGGPPLPALAWRSGPWLAALVAIECALHLLVLVDALASGAPAPRLAGAGDGIAALAAALSILWIGLRRAGNIGHGASTYAAFLWACGLGFYVRLLVLGLSPVGAWDTAALIAAAFGLVFLQRRYATRPLLHLASLMPLAVLMSVPFQLASVETSLGLITVGSVYLCMRRSSGTSLYLGVLALNAAVYLWIPGIARDSGLIQVYLIPACTSVLCLLHLHRDELKPSVAHNARLGAVTMLYASATADVFLVPGIGVFVLALFLSLAGAVLGIALRMRAPLYAGVAFLVVNVLGQLVRFYPDGRLAKAVILMALGATITAAMIAFNVKREAVLRQVRVFRADLARWD